MYLQKNFYVPSGEVFPLIEYCPLFLWPCIVIFQHRDAAKRMYFSFPRKVLSGFAAPFL
jgi:hypothetical protein